MYFQKELTQINLQIGTTTLQRTGKSYRHSSRQSCNEHLHLKNPQWPDKCIYKMRLIYGSKFFFQYQTKIVILSFSNKAYWEHLFGENLDREGTTILWESDKGLNSSQGSTTVLLQVPAFVARNKKRIQGGH